MNQVQNIHYLEKKLANRASLLRHSVQLEKERLENQPAHELAGEAGDSGDEAVAMMIIDLDAARIERHLKEIQAIEAAYNRIENGSYGVCTHCGIDIDYQRLIANPAAHRCIECQRNYENTYAVW